ncbi:hypothetical protein P775_23110 [Puniceibacterium antarcticum]|uniref:tRNA(Ile)-lysidine synthase n=1 Tax=Puniceibacterium antarcticum TaxID=1206336 RepID=A0A2G8R8B7_9RHOB|nr:hypothetical protein P775_23110 [Puniceibacterium antarcticum]
MTQSEGSLDQRFAQSMGSLLGPDFPSDIGLAVSGGGDSMAMLYLAHNWTRVWGVRLWVATVDHGLRPEAAAEAAMVAEECRSLGWPHATLRWHWDGQGNVQNEGRQARLGLIERWRGGLRHVLMAHTQDDLAETFLIRLKRGSGVDGLSAMRAKRLVHVTQPVPEEIAGEVAGATPVASDAPSAGFHVIRPCLEMRREELRHYLRTLQGRWVDDPSNEDTHYDRVRMRRLLATLEGEGLGVETIAATASRMARAKAALSARALAVWADLGNEGQALSQSTGDILFGRAGFDEVEQDSQMRLLAAALQFVSTSPYRPRAEATEALLDRILSGGGGTLQGCDVRTNRDTICVSRELSAVRDQVNSVGDGALWDGRWQVFHPKFKGLAIRALGEDGWAQCGARTGGAPPFRAALVLPSVWDGGRLVACDALAIGPGNTTQLQAMGQERMTFAKFLLSH